MGAAKLTAKFMELMASSPEDQLGDNVKAVMKDNWEIFSGDIPATKRTMKFFFGIFT